MVTLARRTAFGIGSVMLLASALIGGPAGAEAPVAQGWWESSPAGLPAVAADVPAHGLLVEGSTTSTSGSADRLPYAFAALVYPVPTGETAMILTLGVASPSATTPGSVLQLCPVAGGSIAAQQGGPMADAPAFSCRLSVSSGPSSNGATYSFPVSSLVIDGRLAVAILPTAPSDRVVLAQPQNGSLTFAAPTAGTASPGPLPPASPQSTDGGSPSAEAGSSALGSPPVASAAPPQIAGTAPSLATPIASGGPAAPPSSTTSRQPTQQVAVASSDNGSYSTIAASKTSRVVLIVLVLGLVAGACGWLTVGRRAARAAVADERANR